MIEVDLTKEKNVVNANHENIFYSALFAVVCEIRY